MAPKKVVLGITYAQRTSTVRRQVAHYAQRIPEPSGSFQGRRNPHQFYSGIEGQKQYYQDAHSATGPDHLFQAEQFEWLIGMNSSFQPFFISTIGANAKTPEPTVSSLFVAGTSTYLNRRACGRGAQRKSSMRDYQHITANCK